MAISVELNTPLAQALNEAIQPKLVEVGWSTGGGDDSALAEYVILMLVNGKTQEQIASELANDLLGLGPDDTEAVDFSKWLFGQVESLNQQLKGNGEPAATSEPQSVAQAIPSFTEGSNDAVVPAGSQPAPDTEMGDSSPQPRDNVIPSGPRTMRNSRPGGRGRVLGQITRAMDRSNDSVLHRVRNQHGTERINMHREPPKGPRAFQQRGGRLGRPNSGVGMSNSGSNNNNMGMNLMGMANNQMQNMPPGPGMMSPQQQMQMMALFEEQARMMAQFMPGFVAPAINPAFQNAQAPQSQGRSLFDRAETTQGPNSHLQKRNNNTGLNAGQKETSTDTTMGDAPQQNGDRGPDSVCIYNLRCTNRDCIYAHQSPAAPEGTTIDVADVCPFEAACKNRKCVGRHPSPARRAVHQSEELCRYFPHCQNPHCHFKHPNMPMCRNGADCSVPGCKFTHQQVPCRYTPCLNPTCPFKHSEGQKGLFSDKVWTADDNSGAHLSERKFVAEENGEEELIKPPASSSEAEIVT